MSNICLFYVEDAHLVEKYSWSISCGYVTAKDELGKTVKLHRLIVGAPEDKVVDHINGNTLDTRRANLRVCTQAENCANQKLKITNTSGYKGVTYNKQKRMWKAQLTHNYKHYALGSFCTAEEAARAYDQAAIRHFGEFARLNFSEVHNVS